MKLKDLIKLEKEEMKKLSEGIDKKDMDWIIKMLLNQEPDLKNYKSNPESEKIFLSRLNGILHSISVDKPSDIRDYIKQKILFKEYDNKLTTISDQVFSIKPGDVEKCDELKEKVDKLLEQADKEVPGYRESREIQIDEIYGDLLSLKSKGQFGSTRMNKKIKNETKE
jgi:hypothetical protein